jgi:hypothetical protein
VSKVHNAKKGRDSVAIQIYGMEGIPQEIVDERVHQKTVQKMNKLDQELKKMGINVDDPNFDISQFEVPNPRPPKARGYGLP